MSKRRRSRKPKSEKQAPEGRFIGLPPRRVTYADDGMIAGEFPLLKCPACGRIFEDHPIDRFGVDGFAFVPRLAEQQDGKPCWFITSVVDCSCGYIVHCDYEGEERTSWWGQQGEDGKRETLLPKDFIHQPSNEG